MYRDSTRGEERIRVKNRERRTQGTGNDQQRTYTREAENRGEEKKVTAEPSTSSHNGRFRMVVPISKIAIVVQRQSTRRSRLASEALGHGLAVER